jgi:hypothetical protein
LRPRLLRLAVVLFKHRPEKWKQFPGGSWSNPKVAHHTASDPLNANPLGPKMTTGNVFEAGRRRHHPALMQEWEIATLYPAAARALGLSLSAADSPAPCWHGIFIAQRLIGTKS